MRMISPTQSNAPKPDYRATSGAGETDVAIDNLWVTKDDLPMFNIVSGKPATMKKDPSQILVGKNQKQSGTIVYFLPKDKNGKLIDKPIRLLKLSNKPNTYLKAESVVPYYEDVVKNKTYWVTVGGNSLISEAELKLGNISQTAVASNFTGLDDMRQEMDYVGFNGNLDLQNTESLDESISISNVNGSREYGLFSYLTNESLLDVTGIGKARALKNTGRYVNHNGIFRKEGHYEKGTEKRVVDVRMVRFFHPVLKRVEKRNVLIFGDGTAGAPNKWENISGLTNESLLNATAKYFPDKSVYSNLTNESLLNADAKYFPDKSKYSNLTNESLLNATAKYFPDKSIYSNLTNESLLDADGDTEYSNGVGNWFKGLFSGNKKDKKALNKVADPNVSVVDAKTMQQAYQESGSGKSFKDWVNSEGGKGVMNSITMLTSMLINKPATYGSGYGTDVGGGTGGDAGTGSGDGEKSETTILGMSPVTFGIVAVGLIAIGSIVVIKIIKSKQGKK